MGMILLRVLVSIAIGAFIFYWLRRKWRRRDIEVVRDIQALLQCDSCKIRFPATEAIKDQSGTYCCEEHRVAANRSQ
jgi:hypothetical protein